jgi:hypothetical protein
MTLLLTGTHSASSTRKLRLVLRVLLLVWVAGSYGVLGSAETLAQNAYITSPGAPGLFTSTVSVIGTAKCHLALLRSLTLPGRPSG